MTRPNCPKTKSGKRRKPHTPIVSEAQRRLFGAVASGKVTKAPGLSKVEAREHLTEAKGKDLPETAKKKALGRLVKKVHTAKGRRFKVG